MILVYASLFVFEYHFILFIKKMFNKKSFKFINFNKFQLFSWRKLDSSDARDIYIFNKAPNSDHWKDIDIWLSGHYTSD